MTVVYPKPKYGYPSASLDLHDTDAQYDTALEFIDESAQASERPKWVEIKRGCVTEYRRATLVERLIEALKLEFGKFDQESQKIPGLLLGSSEVIVTEDVERFISLMELEQAANTALEIAKEVFGDAPSIQLELDESEGDRHIRLHVDSDIGGDILLDAYERFYLKLIERLPIEQRAYIGLTF